MNQLAEAIQTIADAVEGNRGEQQQAIGKRIVEWGALMLRKNKDYGSAVFSVPEFAPDCDAGAAIRVRMSDKVSRLRTLLASQDKPEVAESITDTVGDLGAYCLLYLVACDLTDEPEASEC